MLRWALALGRTPRELAASVTSEDITEMMAFEHLEPFGNLPQLFGFGQICSVMANLQRDTDKKPDPYRASDFIPVLDVAAGIEPAKPPEPMLLADPEAQTRLIKEAIFGVKPNG